MLRSSRADLKYTENGSETLEITRATTLIGIPVSRRKGSAEKFGPGSRRSRLWVEVLEADVLVGESQLSVLRALRRRPIALPHRPRRGPEKSASAGPALAA